VQKEPLFLGLPDGKEREAVLLVQKSVNSWPQTGIEGNIILTFCLKIYKIVISTVGCSRPWWI